VVYLGTSRFFGATALIAVMALAVVALAPRLAVRDEPTSGRKGAFT